MHILKNPLRAEYVTIGPPTIRDLSREARSFHQQLPSFETTPLLSLDRLSDVLGIEKILVKDESRRLGLKAFKVMGASFAVAKLLQKKSKIPDLDFHALHRERAHASSEGMILATASSGNHGKGVAFAATQLGYPSEIYLPAGTARSRIEAIEKIGGNVTTTDKNYDDTVKQLIVDAKRYGWQIISDTGWEGYHEIPRWVMQGYYAIFDEAIDQIHEVDSNLPTHIFIQGGVGALAASLTGFFRGRFPDETIRIIVVEPETAACLFHSIAVGDGQPHKSPGEIQTMMAGLASGEPNPVAWPIIRDGADVFIHCPDEVSALGMKTYYRPMDEDPKIISGESGAVTLGVLYKIMKEREYERFRRDLNLGRDSTVLLINTEGDTDPYNFQLMVGAVP